jgi:nitrogen fixation-related uncharacterized protein
MKKIYALFAVMLIAFVIIFYCLGWGMGSKYTRDRYERELTAARGLAETRAAELERTLGEFENRAGTIRAGLADAAKLAGKSADRNARVAILVDAIDRAIKELERSASSFNLGK